ncbi:hypothetical protein HanXRQr2_Chr15g0713231 [Helianthus annuus]|uniref:Uncharacterized protein n=1 Tax=Helianthus annuus TaxID=4232 RepID=A0A251SB01_HELAN|nr:hypothetical protein HanXRQr2_Chr15g0713231 [Helianthus annuus]KAJ0832937.1 hypothetical protein HanPSC8_Chr15g0684481 [Helianthus annuus]
MLLLASNFICNSLFPFYVLNLDAPSFMFRSVILLFGEGNESNLCDQLEATCVTN